MKTNPYSLILFVAGLMFACNSPTNPDQTISSEEISVDGGQSTVEDSQSEKNVVGIADGSPDHSTLVEAVKAAELVDALSNAGPFTVFAR